jgi:serine/threonine protein kinase
VGTKLDNKYLVDAVMASGGFSVVYRATHLLWKHPVAIKAFRGPSEMTATWRAQLLEAFVLEGALLAELAESSLAVCQARDIGSLTTASGDSVPFLVLEWLEGETLEAELVAERAAGTPPRSLAAALRLLSPAVAALSRAHGQGICHLDLKPGNLFLHRGADGGKGLKLIDFGGAKVLARSDPSGKEASLDPQYRSFTPGYGAPEQFYPGFGPTGPWTDVFALALTLVEIVTGREPLPGATPSEMAGISVDPRVRPTPRTCGATVSDDIERVFLRALAIDPMKRFATAGEFWKALDLAASDERPEPVLISRPQALSTDAAGGVDADAETRPFLPPVEYRARRARAAWKSAAVAVVVLGTAMLGASDVGRRLGVHIPSGARAMASDIAGLVRSR